MGRSQEANPVGPLYWAGEFGIKGDTDAILYSLGHLVVFRDRRPLGGMGAHTGELIFR